MIVISSCKGGGGTEEGSAPSTGGGGSTPTIEDPTPLATPVITLPLSNPYISNQSSLLVAGACVDGATVNIDGSLTASTTCVGSAFSITLSPTSDNTYNLSITQHSNSLNTSTPFALQWIRDTTTPTLSITSPTANPYTSADTSFTLTGSCENNTTMSLSGNQSASGSCSSNTFNFSINASVDGTYNYSVSTVDAAGNSSTTTFQWIRDTSLPPTPTISSPSSNPYYSNSNSLVITGNCVTGNIVNLNGDATNSAVCNASSFSFTVNKSTDASYTFSITQTDALNKTSGDVSITWTRDTIAPSAPSLASPSSPYHSNNNSIVVTGSCETNALVSISGGAGATACSSGSYSITINRSSDATYNFNISQTDAAGNTSLSTSLQWVRDTSSPNTPTITTPSSSPYITNTNTLLISGSCESQATVALAGSSIQTTACSSNSYSFSVSKTVDASYTFDISQTDIAGNNSTTNTLIWTRDTAAPPAPTIISPTNNPYTSADNSINLVGTCETGATVALSGDSVSSTTCSASSYSIVISKAVDATYNFNIVQTDIAGNTSSSTSFQWIRNTSIPSTPTITTPSSNPYYTNSFSFVISGACTNGDTVELSGDDTKSMTCSSSSYLFNVTESSASTYNYDVKQKNASNIYSAASSIQIIVDTTAPSTPTVSSPATASTETNGNTLIISGACENNATVTVTNSPSNLTTTCIANAFSITINKSTDNNYSFNIYQTDLANNTSGLANRIWIRDTIAPAAPTLNSPLTNPYTSGDANLTISGACQNGTTLTLTEYTGSDRATITGTPQNVTCNSMQFSYALYKTTNTTYYYTITQTDTAGNESSELDFTWTKDSALMMTPVISYNSTVVSAPIYTNTNSIALNATCTQATGNVVYISGDVVIGDISEGLSQTCDNESNRTFTVSKSSDGTYNLNFYQDNATNGTISAVGSAQWIRDTLAPAIPVITAPSSSPYTAPGNLTITGTCEDYATVHLNGDATSSVACANNRFEFVVLKSSDATYNFTIYQSDRAGNSSSNSIVQWIRDTNSVPPPTINTPSLASTTNNSSSFSISGLCNTGYVVTISGNVVSGDVTIPSNSLTQTCTGGNFSYSITKSADSTFIFNLKQTHNSVDSSLSTVSWTRDTLAPTTTLTSYPGTTNLSTTASFSWSSSETATYECKIDSGSYSSCTSPLTYNSLSNGSHTFYVRSIDSANNVGVQTTHSWTQAAYNTIALFHFDSASPETDSGNYTQLAGYNNSLTAVGTPTTIASGKFSQGIKPSSGNYYSNATNAAPQSLGTTAITIQGFFQVPTTWGTSAYTLVSKNGGASGSYGWEVRIKKNGGNNSSTKCQLQLLLTTSSTTVPTTVLAPTSFTCGQNNTTWMYFAVKWSAAASGAVNFYASALSTPTALTNLGQATFGTTASVLATNSANLRVGFGGTGSTAWIGGLDEVRISQSSRDITTVPNSVFTAD